MRCGWTSGRGEWGHVCGKRRWHRDEHVCGCGEFLGLSARMERVVRTSGDEVRLQPRWLVDALARCGLVEAREIDASGGYRGWLTDAGRAERDARRGVRA